MVVFHQLARETIELRLGLSAKGVANNTGGQFSQISGSGYHLCIISNWSPSPNPLKKDLKALKLL